MFQDLRNVGHLFGEGKKKHQKESNGFNFITM